MKAKQTISQIVAPYVIQGLKSAACITADMKANKETVRTLYKAAEAAAINCYNDDRDPQAAICWAIAAAVSLNAKTAR